jgi:hypothetical protein
MPIQKAIMRQKNIGANSSVIILTEHKSNRMGKDFQQPKKKKKQMVRDWGICSIRRKKRSGINEKSVKNSFGGKGKSFFELYKKTLMK